MKSTSNTRCEQREHLLQQVYQDIIKTLNGLHIIDADVIIK